MKQKIKIFIAVLGAFCIARSLNGSVFYANTPYINQPYLESVAALPGRVRQGVMTAFSGEKSTSDLPRGKQMYTSRTYPTPADSRGYELMAQGFDTNKPGVFEKQDVVARKVTIEITDDVQYEKRLVVIGGQMVEAWVPKE